MVRAVELISFEIPTMVFVIINMLILYFFLKKVLFKPVTRFMEKRTEAIKEQIEGADGLRREAEGMRDEYGRRLQEIKAEADRILGDARMRAEREYAGIMANAKEDSERLMERTKGDMALERDKAVAEAKAQIGVLAIVAASGLVGANLDDERNAALVRKFIDEAGMT
ncbi:MAG: F0F1 ATP synthase subunit B [Oscillospiraceae bacterium]|nr:F0F1 ATP synthase subunit B [Oscillospiraceae bacterium]